ncbi:MAG: hypothetical protein MZV64_73750 [Ignavibacteriales bacterium]|nr:hypothetical protein [Ignavibacteriales bacterium]
MYRALQGGRDAYRLPPAGGAPRGRSRVRAEDRCASHAFWGARRGWESGEGLPRAAACGPWNRGDGMCTWRLIGPIGCPQAAEKGPSAALARSRGAAAYGVSTPRTAHRAPPGIWTFSSSLGEKGFLSILLLLVSACAAPISVTQA